MTVNNICPNFEVVARKKHVRSPPEYINSHIQISMFIVQLCRLSTLLEGPLRVRKMIPTPNHLRKKIVGKYHPCKITVASKISYQFL